ncbi:MAG: MotA/TolQ/ExbB proton channel family protein [Planctomycetaceae bacterium]|nr:MotA/TolQ/ExbB proton channel family protein [Planctomycetaceae bacterium]
MGRTRGLFFFVVAFALGIYVAAGNDYGGVMLFCDSPSFFFVFGGTLGLAAFSFSTNTWGRGLSVLTRSCPREHTDEAIAFWNGLGLYALLSGIAGTIIGVVTLFQNLSDISKFGPSIAVSLVSMTYGVLVFTLCKAVAISAKAGSE